MRLGVAVDLGSAAATRPQVDRAAKLLETARASGLSSAWVGESYHARPEVFHLPAALIVLGHLAGRTDLPLGTAVLLARAYEPRRLAYEAALLDQLCGGRLTLGLALGNADLAGRVGGGTGDRRPAEWFADLVVSLRETWSSAGVAPPPARPGGPPMLLGGRTRAGAVRAATIGDGYYAATNYGDGLLAARAADYWDARAGEPGEVAVTRLCLVAEDAGEARESAARYFAPVTDYYTSRRAWFGQDGPEQPRFPLVGSPADVVAALRRYASSGVTSVQLRVAPYGTPPEVARRTLELVGTAVLPELDKT
ncbi:LLM class flavin-dependent oxidoreductase [Actinomadura darangshiensis]|uniref:LLM class flavin-dependent oxidoreductase n=1 Tax=Actinomadura darangshiensis TaxID=705336 RepID=A0A4V2YV40_9ACTN|nr:LLM class flavin-dependent oxidoreductase [Actinomadura darangshiensis]TDD79767.1 LLM class flavin-dependent oxidoreductase [Actinomadura darangshiensis]